MPEDWQHNESFAHTNLRMFDDGHLCDVTLLAGEERTEVRCHRFILASRSPVFHAMFCGSLPEKGVVEIPDIEPDVLKKVVRFLYTSSVDLDPESVLFMDYAAHKYTIKGLEAKCKAFLENNMSVDSVCTILEHAAKFDRKELVENCMKLVNDNSKAVFKSDPFLSVSHKVLELIVEQASSTSPLDIYEACTKWAKRQIEQHEGDVCCEKIRDILSVLTSKIRFNEMSYEDFIENVVKDRILSDSDVVKYLLDIRENKITSGKEIHICRSSGSVTPYCNRGKQDGISFSVSTDVWLTAVDLFLPSRKDGKLTGPFEVFEDKTQVLKITLNLNGQVDKQFESFKLPVRVRLRAGKVYSLRQRLNGDTSYCASTCSSNVSVDDVNVTFMELQVGSSDGCTKCNYGQFYGMTLMKD